MQGHRRCIGSLWLSSSYGFRVRRSKENDLGRELHRSNFPTLDANMYEQMTREVYQKRFTESVLRHKRLPPMAELDSPS